jgi:hypothetical protein
MAITVKHNKVSTIPDDADTSLVRPSDWNDDHVLTGTVPVANGGTGASTLTGYVKGNGTSAMTAATTIPNTDITGLGTASTKDAGAALGVATLDATGKVPVSELPAAVLGALSYQGTWDASTNTPTLTSSVGTKGYYYVVSVAGSTNLNGITDWQVGDWAVYNGTAWQKVDNTDAVTSVNGYTGTVVLTAADVSAVPYTGATGAVDLNAKSLTNVSNLGIGTTTVPTISMRAVGNNNSTSRIAMRGYSSDANSSAIRVTKFRGTAGAPQAPLSGDSLGKFELAGYGTTSSEGYPQSSLEGVATENWGATARGTKALVKVTPNTTTTQVTALTIDQNSAATFASSVTATSFSGSGSGLTGVVTSVTGTAPVVSSGGATPAISMAAANTTTNGYLTSTDWNTFNSKGSGTVTSVSGTASNISSTGGTTPVIDLVSTAVTPATYTLATITVDAKGRITSASNGSSAGTVTSVAASVPSFLSVSGSPITTSGTLAISYSGTALPLANGGTASTSAPQANATLRGWTTTATAAGTTTLTNASSYQQEFTGTTTQTVVMPVTSTLALGWSFEITNNSTGAVTVQSSGLNTIGTVNAGTTASLVCVAITGTTAASWDFDIDGFATETGTGSVVRATSPTLVTPALGTPASGVVTNLTGTASININGTVGATTANTGAFTTLSATGAVTLSPANLAVAISPSGTGTVTISPVGALTINPTAASTINNTSIGATTASTGRFTTVTSTVATGTAPFTVASTTQVANLNAATAGTATNQSGGTVAATTISASGVITSTVATGTAPFTVASTTAVANLSIGGNAATATTASTVGYQPSRTDATAYPILWGTGTTTTSTYSCAAVTIQSSTGTVNATNVSTTSSVTAAGGFIATSAAPFYLNATTVSANYTSPANYNLMSAGPITINTGVTVTIDTTGTWVIV